MTTNHGVHRGKEYQIARMSPIKLAVLKGRPSNGLLIHQLQVFIYSNRHNLEMANKIYCKVDLWVTDNGRNDRYSRCSVDFEHGHLIHDGAILDVHNSKNLIIEIGKSISTFLTGISSNGQVNH